MIEDYTGEDLPEFDETWDFDRQIEEQYFNGYLVYKDNGVEIMGCPEAMNYVIHTDKYIIYWYIDPSNDLIILPSISRGSRTITKSIFNQKILFDLSFFAVLDPNNTLKVQFACEDMVHRQVERLLNLRVFT